MEGCEVRCFSWKANLVRCFCLTDMSLVMCTQLFCFSFKRHIFCEMYTIIEALDDDVHLRQYIARGHPTVAAGFFSLPLGEVVD